MYVRWQYRWERKRKDAFARYWRSPKSDAYAVLVESSRIDGKSRQRHIAYLGSALDLDNQTDLYRWCWWDEINERLDRLGNVIPAEQRPSIEAALAKKVPMPPPGFKPDKRSDADQNLFGAGTGRITFAAALGIK
jgi:hypothetical protein